MTAGGAPETAAERPESGWVPYVAPYFAFLAIVQLQSPGWFDGSLLLRALQVAVPAGLLLYYFRQGAFPELRGFRWTLPGVAGDVLLGLAIAALWIVPFEAGWLEKPEKASFDPSEFGEGYRDLALGLRLAGYALVTPFVEELFVRSFLIRAAELLHLSRERGLEIDSERDFRDFPMARFAWKGFVGTVLFFTFTHVPWQWGVAFVTGVVWNLWLYQRGHILPLVISHAVANGAIWLATVTDGFGLTDAEGSPLDLWYQL